MKTNLLKLMAIIRLLILIGALAGGVNTVLAAENEKEDSREEQKAEAEDDDDDDDENEDEDDDGDEK